MDAFITYDLGIWFFVFLQLFNEFLLGLRDSEFEFSLLHFELERQALLHF